MLFNGSFDSGSSKLQSKTYKDFVASGEYSKLSDTELTKKESLVRAGDTVNLQFTSGWYSRTQPINISDLTLQHQARPVARRQPCCRTCKMRLPVVGSLSGRIPLTSGIAI